MKFSISSNTECAQKNRITLTPYQSWYHVCLIRRFLLCNAKLPHCIVYTAYLPLIKWAVASSIDSSQNNYMYSNAPSAWRKRPSSQPGDGADFSEQPRNKLVKHVRRGDSLLMEMDIDSDPPPLTSTTTDGITFEPNSKFIEKLDAIYCAKLDRCWDNGRILRLRMV
jgi:hypothetical protein